MRRWKRRYERVGDDGLFDRRRSEGVRSPNGPAPVAQARLAGPPGHLEHLDEPHPGGPVDPPDDRRVRPGSEGDEEGGLQGLIDRREPRGLDICCRATDEAGVRAGRVGLVLRVVVAGDGGLGAEELEGCLLLTRGRTLYR